MRGTQRFRRRKGRGREHELGSVAVALEGIRKELDRYRTPGIVDVERRELLVGTSGRVGEQG